MYVQISYKREKMAKGGIEKRNDIKEKNIMTLKEKAQMSRNWKWSCFRKVDQNEDFRVFAFDFDKSFEQNNCQDNEYKHENPRNSSNYLSFLYTIPQFKPEFRQQYFRFLYTILQFKPEFRQQYFSFLSTILQYKPEFRQQYFRCLYTILQFKPEFRQQYFSQQLINQVKQESMGALNQKPSLDLQILENPRLNKNIIRRRIFDGIDSPQHILNLWLNLVNYSSLMSQQSDRLDFNYQKLHTKGSEFSEMIKKDIPRTFPQQKHMQIRQEKQALQRVLLALSNRLPQMGYVSGMSFYVQRVLQIAPQQKAYHILAWLYRNDSIIYNLSSTKYSIQPFIEVVNQMVDKQCPNLTDVLKHINISIGVFCVSWIQSLFSLVLDKPLFYTLLSLALLQGPQIWILATISLIKSMEQPMMKSNRTLQKILQITSSRNPLPTIEKKLKFISYLEQILEKHKLQIHTYIHKITSRVPLEQQWEIKNSQVEENIQNDQVSHKTITERVQQQ